MRKLAALSAVIALLLFVAAVGLLVGWRTPPHFVEPPGRKEAPTLVTHAMNLDQIRGFDFYYGQAKQDDAWRDLNPFVPWAERVKIQAVRKPAVKRPVVKPPDPIPVRKPVDPRKSPPTVKLPKKVLPQFRGGDRWVPKVIGQLHMADDEQILVEHEGERLVMRPGDMIGDWTLKRVRPTFAVFLDGKGEERVLPFGHEGSAVTP